MKSSNKSWLIHFCVAAAWLSFGSSWLQAQEHWEPRRLAFQLTASVQTDDGSAMTGTPAKVTTVRLATKDVLSLVTNALHTTFPKDSCLAVDGGRVVLCAPDGYCLADVSSYFTVNLGATNGVGHGHVESCLMQVNFDDRAGNAFSLWALSKGTYSWSRMDSTGAWRVNLSTTANAVGQGSIGGKRAVFSGTIMSRAKGVEGGGGGGGITIYAFQVLGIAVEQVPMIWRLGADCFEALGSISRPGFYLAVPWGGRDFGGRLDPVTDRNLLLRAARTQRCAGEAYLPQDWGSHNDNSQREMGGGVEAGLASWAVRLKSVNLFLKKFLPASVSQSPLGAR